MCSIQFALFATLVPTEHVASPDIVRLIVNSYIYVHVFIQCRINKYFPTLFSHSFFFCFFFFGYMKSHEKIQEDNRFKESALSVTSTPIMFIFSLAIISA